MSAPADIDATLRLAVVIPCFDEAVTIGRVVEDFRKALPEARIFVFDNNSRDASAEIARAAGARVVASPLQGKGHVVRHIADAVDADVYVLVDGDDTYPADTAPEMVRRLCRENLDMLVGARLEDYEAGAFRPFHRAGNRVISWLIRLLFRARLRDVLSGYRVLSRTFVDLVRLRRAGFEVETEMTLQALAKGLRIAEVAVPYRRRPRGSQSKLDTWSDGFLIARCIAMLFKDYKPLLFFSSLSALMALAALAAGSAPILDFARTGLVFHMPRAVLAASLGTLSIIFLTAGLILDTIAKYHEETIGLWRRSFRRHP
ncbi:MAG TPA: glycosyltransferase family 2 protein [Myxococcota bacterium]|nr:glycosyltransferase family 2 protein [Myxococcota bacterium]